MTPHPLIAAERKRIASDVHDHVLSSVYAAMMHIAGIADERAVAAHRILDDSVAHLRALVGGSPLDSPLGALHNIWKDIPGVDVTVSISGDDESLSMTDTADIRGIVMELVTNALKHDNACEVDVQVKINGDHTVIVVGGPDVNLDVLDGREGGLGRESLGYRTGADGTITSVRRPSGGHATVIQRPHSIRWAA